MLRRCSIFTLQLLRCALPRFPWKGFPASLPATGVRRWPNAKSTGPGGQTKTGLPQQAGERPGVNVVRLAGFPCYRGVPQILVWCPALRPGSFGGAEEARTPDIRLAKAALSQLSYGPSGCTVCHVRWTVATAPTRPEWMVGHSGLEPETSVLSGLRSNQLS